MLNLMTEETSVVVMNTSGRRLIFTPERIQQITNLVERGLKRDEIAGIIGCTPGTLSVTCSRLGISLRKPKDIGYRPSLLFSGGNGDDKMDKDEKLKEIIELPHDDSPPVPKVKVKAALRIEIRYQGVVRSTPIELNNDELLHILIIAQMNNMSLAEVINRIIEDFLSDK